MSDDAIDQDNHSIIHYWMKAWLQYYYGRILSQNSLMILLVEWQEHFFFNEIEQIL